MEPHESQWTASFDRLGLVGRCLGAECRMVAPLLESTTQGVSADLGRKGGGMGRLLVAVDPAVGVEPADLVVAWNDDREAAGLGAASVESPNGEVLLPGLLELVAIPIAVNLASAVLYDVVRRLVRRRRPEVTGPELELVEITTAQGDRVVVVRLTQGRP